MSLHFTISRLQLLLLISALALVLGAGCGGNGDGGDTAQSSDSDVRLYEQAEARSKKAADRVVQATRDKNLPGPKSYKAVCVQRGDESARPDVPPNGILCHIEAFYDNYRGKRGGYIWSEDWFMPLQGGKLGEPAIHGEYRIRNFLREDNKRNCTGRHRPGECLPESEGGQLPD